MDCKLQEGLSRITDFILHLTLLMAFSFPSGLDEVQINTASLDTAWSPSNYNFPRPSQCEWLDRCLLINTI